MRLHEDPVRPLGFTIRWFRSALCAGRAGRRTRYRAWWRQGAWSLDARRSWRICAALRCTGRRGLSLSRRPGRTGRRGCLSLAGSQLLMGGPDRDRAGFSATGLPGGCLAAGTGALAGGPSVGDALPVCFGSALDAPGALDAGSRVADGDGVRNAGSTSLKWTLLLDPVTGRGRKVHALRGQPAAAGGSWPQSPRAPWRMGDQQARILLMNLKCERQMGLAAMVPEPCTCMVR